MIASGSYQRGGELVRVGDIAMERYVAPRDTIDSISTDKLKESAANSVGPIYKIDTVAESNSIQQINEVFQELNTILNRLEHMAIDEELEALEQEVLFLESVKEMSLTLPVVFTDAQLKAYQTLSSSARNNFSLMITDYMTQMYSQGVLAEELEMSKAELEQVVKESTWNNNLQIMAYMIISSALEPNLILDEVAMEIARESKRNEVADVFILKNQKIIDEGEIINQDIYDRLVLLDLIGNTEVAHNAIPILGSILLVTLIFILLILFSKGGQTSKYILQSNQHKMLFWLYVMMILLIRVMVGVSYFTLLPLELFAMLVSALIDKRMSLLFHTCFCIIGCIIFSGDIEFLVYGLISGSFAAILIQKTQQRSQTVPVALGMAGVNFMAMFAVGLFFRQAYTTDLLMASILGALMGLISVIIALGSLPFWEEVFEANTPLYLLELTNPNNELLRRLMIEAPGTYHHSLLVANLAETAVYAIGGNTALARAGAYYHDIGKIKSPMYFAENQMGYNPHNELAPEASAKIITSHTKNGYALGIEHKLPKQVLNIMVEHHGNSLVKYFYYEALKLYGAEQVKEEDYRYKGEIPQSRESAVIMLADTTEAAVRAMLGKGKTLDDTEDFIKTLIKDKLDDGQLDESKLAIHELKLIRKAFMEVFRGMHHERVSYPKPEDVKALREAKKEE